MSRFAKLAAATALAGVFVAGGASAATYSDQASFAAATSGLTTIDFNNTANGSEVYRGPSYSLNGATFSGLQLYSVSPGDGFDAGTQYGSDYLEFQGGSGATPQSLNVTLPSAVTAIGFDLDELRGNAAVFTVVAGGVTSTINTQGEAFFGGTFSSPLTSFTVSTPATNAAAQNNFGTIDNLSFGNAGAASVSAAPEPGTWALMLGGVGMLGAFLRIQHARRREDDVKDTATA